jgi:hypothetical protein
MSPMFLTRRAFPRRVNADGTHDSICIDCFRTVGTAQRESDLKPFEEHHVCDEEDLYLWRRQPLSGETCLA